MGQRAAGILYGVEAPEMSTAESEEPLYDLIDRWEKAKGIGWDYKGLKVRNEHEGGKDLLGVWVAVGGCGEDGAPYFLDTCMPLSEVESYYAKEIAAAKKVWDRFAAHVAKKEKIDLPAAQLWLTPCETA